MADDSEGRVAFYHLDAGTNLAFLAELGVSGLPTFMFYSRGELKATLAGTNVRMEEVEAETQKLLAM